MFYFPISRSDCLKATLGDLLLWIKGKGPGMSWDKETIILCPSRQEWSGEYSKGKGRGGSQTQEYCEAPPVEMTVYKFRFASRLLSQDTSCPVHHPESSSLQWSPSSVSDKSFPSSMRVCMILQLSLFGGKGNLWKIYAWFLTSCFLVPFVHSLILPHQIPSWSIKLLSVNFFSYILSIIPNALQGLQPCNWRYLGGVIEH